MYIYKKRESLQLCAVIQIRPQTGSHAHIGTTRAFVSIGTGLGNNSLNASAGGNFAASFLWIRVRATPRKQRTVGNLKQNEFRLYFWDFRLLNENECFVLCFGVGGVGESASTNPVDIPPFFFFNETRVKCCGVFFSPFFLSFGVDEVKPA